jgi:hypothetical protein
MGGLAHSAGNALRMANVESVVPLLASGTPLEQARARELQIGGRSARALVALVEIAARPGPLQRKFQTESSYDLATCLTDAQEMVEAYRRSSSQLAEVEIHRGKWINARFPEGYLDQVYSQTFLYEILLNVSKHGRTFENGDRTIANARISSILEGRALKIIVSNPLSDADAMRDWSENRGLAIPKYKDESPYKTHGFLKFIQALPTYIPGINISSTIKEAGQYRFYNSVLTFGPIEIEIESGRRHMKVQPHSDE